MVAVLLAGCAQPPGEGDETDAGRVIYVNGVIEGHPSVAVAGTHTTVVETQVFGARPANLTGALIVATPDRDPGHTAITQIRYRLFAQGALVAETSTSNADGEYRMEVPAGNWTTGPLHISYASSSGSENPTVATASNSDFWAAAFVSRAPDWNVTKP